MIPANPGGGWDQTGRSIEQVMRAAGIMSNFQFENVPGAGGAVGLPRFLAMRGQGDMLMVGGMVSRWVGSEVPRWAAEELKKMGGITGREITRAVLVLLALAAGAAAAAWTMFAHAAR